MRDVGHEPPVLLLGCLESADRVGQRCRHPIEPLGPRPELVPGDHWHASGQIATFDPFGGQTRLLDRREHPAGDGTRRDQGDHSCEQRSDCQGGSQLIDRLPDAFDRANEIEGRPNPRRPTSDDE